MTKGELTRRKIIEAAAPIFNRYGYEGSSLNALMEATGLKKGGIYRHFASKEELAAEAFDYTWESAWKTRLLRVDEKANGIEKLKQFIANFVESRGPVRGGCPVLNTAVDADDGNPVLRARVAKALRTWVGRLEGFVLEAQQAGEGESGSRPQGSGNADRGQPRRRSDDVPHPTQRRRPATGSVSSESISGPRSYPALRSAWDTLRT